MWMRALTPVMNSAIVIESGSARNPTSTRSPPAGTHSNSVCVNWRPSSGSPSRPAYTTTDATKLPVHITVASQPAAGSARRLPANRRIRKPASGNAGINQTASSTAGSTLQYRDVVGRGARPLAQQGDDDGQSHHDLGRGHHENEHHDRQSPCVAHHARERDEGEGHGVEHQLHAHEHHQRIAADQQPEGADGEDRRAQDQVPRGRDLDGRDHEPTSWAGAGSLAGSGSASSAVSPLRAPSVWAARASASAIRSVISAWRSAWPGSTISSSRRTRRASSTAPTTAITSRTDVIPKAYR